MRYEPYTNEFRGIIRSYSAIKNPQIQLTINGDEDPKYPRSSLLDFSTKNGVDSPHLVINPNSKNPHPSLDITLNNWKLIISHYIIRSHVSNHNYLYSWQLMGSNDQDSSWKNLHKKENSEDLSNGKSQIYEIEENIPFTKFRLEMLTNTKGGDKSFRLLNIDFYGIIYNNKFLKTCITNNNFKVFNSLLYIMIIK